MGESRFRWSPVWCTVDAGTTEYQRRIISLQKKKPYSLHQVRLFLWDWKSLLDTFEITSELYQRNGIFGSPLGGWKILRLTVRARGIGHKSGDVFGKMHKVLRYSVTWKLFCKDFSWIFCKISTKITPTWGCHSCPEPSPQGASVMQSAVVI